MGKKKRPSASRRKQPPPSTTVDQASQPPSPPVEALDPLIKDWILRAVTALLSGEHKKALDFIKESVSWHPLSGYLHYVEGVVHKSLAVHADEDSDARLKHLEDGLLSSQLAVELLPNSIHCASLHADLLYQLAFLDQGWERVIEVCKCALKIKNPCDSVVGEIFQEDISYESRIENEKKALMIVLQDAEAKNLEFSEKKKDSKVDINNVVMAIARRKKQFRAVTRVCRALQQKMIDNSKKKSDGDDGQIVEYKRFWSSLLSDEIKRGFQKVNIEELQKHLESLKCQLAVEHLSEAIDFAKKQKTLKFWECYDCVENFEDYESYRRHFWNEHWIDTVLKLKLDFYIESKAVDMIVNCPWKPVDNAEATKIIVDHIKSKSCSTSDSELGKIDNNESSKTSVDDPKWTFCDDKERAELLVRIRGIIEFLLKNSCLASSQLRCAIEYTKDQFERTISLSQFRNLGLETLQIICCLGASQLTDVLEFLRDVAYICGLSEDADISSSMNKPCGDLFDVRIDFNKDKSCLLWQELQGRADDTNNSYAIEEDGSAIIIALECEEDVFSPEYDIVSWLHLGSNCGEAFESWTCLRDFQRGQAMKFLKMFDEELLCLSTLHNRHVQMSRDLEAVQVVGSMIVEEITKMEKCPEEQTQHLLDLLKKRQKKILEIDDISDWTELEVICNILGDAEVVGLSSDQSGSEECSEEDKWKQQDNAIKKTLRRLKLQLLKELSLIDAVFLRSFSAIKQYEGELASISVYDYRSIIVPMLKTFLQPHLKDLYENAIEKSKAAEEALLAEMALEAERKIKKDSDNVKHKQDKKKKKKKKNKNPQKAKDSELHQKGAEQEDNPDSKKDDSLNEPNQLTVSDEERKLEEYLENQRQFENEASRNVNASSTSRPEELLGDSVSLGGNAVECVSDISSESNREEYAKRFLSDIEKAICLSLDCFEKYYGVLLPADVNDGRTSRLDVQLYVIVQSQWYLRQIRDEFMSRPDKSHTHAGEPCFHCAYHDTFAARRIASRDMPEEAVKISSGKLSPVDDFFKEWLNMENQVNKAIIISPSACQLKQQLTEVFRKIVLDLEHDRQINNKGQEKAFAEQNMA